MAFGLKVFDGSGNVTFDSTVAVGFVPIGVFNIAGGASGFTNTYPALAGRTPVVIPFDAGTYGLTNVTTDVSLGYPRLTVTTASGRRLFMLGVK
jgi:hypothetical protein